MLQDGNEEAATDRTKHLLCHISIRHELSVVGDEHGECRSRFRGHSLVVTGVEDGGDGNPFAPSFEVGESWQHWNCHNNEYRTSKPGWSGVHDIFAWTAFI
jgi:hypothetical protein